MVHEYLLCVTFVASKIFLRHPKRDASKNVPTPTVSEYYEILSANWIFRDDSNGEIRFVIRDLENKLRIFNRNYNFVTEITIFALFPEIGISRVLQNKSMRWIPNLADWRSQDLGSKGQPNCKDFDTITVGIL